MRSFVRVCLCAGISLAVGAPLHGQGAASALTGVVRDSAGTPLPTVEIIATNVGTGYEYGAATTVSGLYWLAGLPPGEYEVVASRIGIQTTRYDGVSIPVGKTLTLDMRLAVAALEVEGVRVVASRPLLASTQSDIAFSLDQDVIRQLPEESRQFIDLAQLVPGATTASMNGRNGGSGGIGSPSVSVGALNTQSLGVFVDGADFTEALFGEVAGGVPLLAIQEFEVIQTQYSARFGRAASGVVNAVTRRGGNEAVFEAFGLGRHQRLNALGEFETVKPDFNRSHWGVAYGGALVRDRTHIFAAFERRVQNDFVVVNTNGVFPALEGSVSTPLTDNLLFARLDHRVNERHDLALRVTGQKGARVTLFSEFGGAASPDHTTRNEQDMYSALLTHRWSVSDAVLSQSQLHVTNQRSSRLPETTVGPALVYPSVITGPSFERYFQDNTRIEFNTDLSSVRTGLSGTHRLQVGTQLSLQDSEAGLRQFAENAVCLFDDDAAPMPFVCRVVVGESVAGGGLKPHQNLQIGAYVQDDWSPKPGLTFNIGVRYDIETNGAIKDVSPFAALLPVFAQEPRSIDKNNIAPRIGFAWEPNSDGRTVVRGGFGIFYDKLALFPIVSLEETSGFQQIDVFNPTTTDADELRTGIDPTTVPPRVWTVGEIRTPMTRQFSLGVERTLTSDLVVRLDGLYSQGRNLLAGRELQIVDPVTGPRYPGVGPVTQILGDGLANAKMLMVDVRKSFSRGWASLSYTLADRENTNDVWLESLTQNDPDSNDLSSLLAPAGWDERHRIVGVGRVQVVDGLSVSGKMIYSSAKPFTSLSGTDDNNDGNPFNDLPAGERRNQNRGPGFFRTDLSITWNVAAVGGRQLGVMVNAYNLFNTTNLDPESVTRLQGSPSFGEAVSALPKRQIELGVQIR